MTSLGESMPDGHDVKELGDEAATPPDSAPPGTGDDQDEERDQQDT